MSEKVEADVDDHLSLNEQIVLEDQSVEGDVDCALDGVLDGSEAQIDAAVSSRFKYLGDRSAQMMLRRGQVGLGEKCFLGKGAWWSEIGHMAYRSGRGTHKGAG